VFAGFRFPREVISLAVRWYLRYGLSYRDVEELPAERGITVDHVTIYRWVQRFTLGFIEAARSGRHAPGDRWFADETSMKVAGQWVYLSRAIDQHGQVIDVFLSARRDLAAARRFFARALRAGTVPAEVTTDRAPVYPRVLDELVPSALPTVEQYANNPIEADHGRLKARLRPMRGLKRTAASGSCSNTVQRRHNATVRHRALTLPAAVLVVSTINDHLGDPLVGSRGTHPLPSMAETRHGDEGHAGRRWLVGSGPAGPGPPATRTSTPWRMVRRLPGTRSQAR
jgi:transposase-like protein